MLRLSAGSGLARTGHLNSVLTAGKSYSYLTDTTGNVLGLVNETGPRTHTYAYSPTGVPRPGLSETVAQPYRFVAAIPCGIYDDNAC